MFDGQGVQWDISNIFRPYCPYLVCGKLTSKTYPPYEKVNFQNHFFTNLKVDSDSSQKSVYTNYSSFLNIPTRSWSNTQKRPFFEGKLNFYKLTLNFQGFLYFWPTSNKNFFKRRAVCVHTFSRGIRIYLQTHKKIILKIDLSIAGVGFLVRFPTNKITVESKNSEQSCKIDITRKLWNIIQIWKLCWKDH